MGIHGKLHKWIESFLKDRQQTVVVNGIKSEPQQVISGVPQGSVLGPLIFLILIGDIDHEVLLSLLKSFADDTRALKGITTINDTNTLQLDLEKVYKWVNENNMKLNEKKFEALRYGTNVAIHTNTNYHTPSGSIIKAKENLCDLGVIMSNDCTFDLPRSNIIEKEKSKKMS